MDHESIEGLIPAYALGATDADESEAVERHLPSCDACRAWLAEYRGLGEDLLYTAPVVTAPSGLTERMRRRLESPRRRGTLEPWWARLRVQPLALLLGAAVLLLVVTNFYWFGRFNRLQQQTTAQVAALADLSSAAAIPLRADPSGGRAQGVVYELTGGQIALLCVYDMSALPPDKTYQLWLIKNGNRESGGLFQVTQDGFGLLVIRPERPLTEYSAVGITAEPAGGSAAPTSPRVLGGNL
jgi:anti-sigma-K factor RskA